MADAAPGELHLPLEANVITGALWSSPSARADQGAGFLIGAGAAAGVGAAAGAGIGIDGRARASPAAAPSVPDVELGRAAGRAAPPASTRGPPIWPSTSRATPIPPRCYDRLLFFDVIGTPTPALRPACLRPRCGRSSGRSRGCRQVCCSPRAGAAGLLHGRAQGHRSPPAAKALLRLRTARDRRLPPLPPPRLRRRIAAGDVEAALTHGTPIPYYTDRPSHCASRPASCGCGRRGPLSPGTGLPAEAAGRWRNPARPAGAGERAAVHGVQVGSQAQPGDRGRRDDHRRPVSPAVPRCTPAICGSGSTTGTRNSRSRARRPDVRPAVTQEQLESIHHERKATRPAGQADQPDTGVIGLRPDLRHRPQDGQSG